MGKFALGEIAEHVGGGDFKSGELVRIIGIGPFTHTYDGVRRLTVTCDYRISPVDRPDCDAYCCESDLRKRPQPGDTLQNFRENLKPCEDLFRKCKWMEPVLNPEPSTLEARIATVFPSLEQIQRAKDILDRQLDIQGFCDDMRRLAWSYGARHLQPFDHFFGGFDA